MEIRVSLGLALITCIGCLPVNADSVEGGVWQDESTHSTNFAEGNYQQARILTLDKEQMLNRLTQRAFVTSAKAYKSATKSKAKKELKIDLPLPNGELISVSIVEDNVLPEALKAKYPKIMTFKVLPDERVVSGRLDNTDNGFHGMLQTRDGETIFIDPIISPSIKNNAKVTYASYKKSAQKYSHSNQPFSCSAVIERESAQRAMRSVASKVNARGTKSLLNYRIAIAATGEYTAQHGGTVASALSAIVTTLNRVNQVYEQDLGIHLSLIDNNDLLIYTDATSDPYNAGTSDDRHTLLIQNQENINAVIGSANYDVGHLFSISGGGLAAIGSVCNDNRKAQGVSGSSYVNDSFALDFVAHEIGHQFGATHSFNGTEGLCAGNTRTARTAFEPGSGSSIMSYAGYCGRDNIQTNSDAMFHIGSIQQIRSYVTTSSGSSCGVQSTVSNAPPNVNAGKNYVIPARTPFELQGSATDSDNDPLVYTWEQVDVGSASLANQDKGNNALFRVHLPSQSKKRSFPPVSDIIAHTEKRGEILPVQQRVMKFKFVVQDSHNITQSDNMEIYVQRTGSRFALNLPRSQYTVGETYKIRWNVANTDKSPVNCENVDISLSTNGGYQFNYNLGKNIPNTGEAWITIPSGIASTNRGRFKIRCSDNVFFALSFRDFALNQQDHESRVKRVDEDQPETNLADKPAEEKETVVNKVTAGGGSYDWILSLVLVGLFFRKRLRYSQ